jgi:cytochrome c
MIIMINVFWSLIPKNDDTTSTVDNRLNGCLQDSTLSKQPQVGWWDKKPS